MVTIAPVNVFNGALFVPFTLAPYREALTSCCQDSPMLSVGALWADQPVGLVVGGIQSNRIGRVLSLYVDTAHRRRGIGAALLRALECSLSARGCTHGEVRYELGTTGTRALERTLQRCGWPVPGDRLHFFALDGRITSTPWFRNAVLPPDYVIAPWLSLSSDERRTLDDSQSAERWIPELLQPHRHETDVEAVTSLVLRRSGSIIGWTLTRALDDQTVHYRNVYVRESCNRVGATFAALGLIAEAVRRQAAARGVRSRGLFEVSSQNRAFLRFVDRHLANDLLSKRVMQRSSKPLSVSSAGAQAT